MCEQPARLLLLSMTLCTWAGCATDPFRVVPLPPGSDPNREISKLEGRLVQASNDDVDVYSGHYYERAKDALEDAKNDRSGGASNEDLLETLSGARADLDYAIWRASIGRHELREVDAARRRALAAHADEFTPQNLAKADGKLLKLAAEIEDGADSLPQEEVRSVSRDYRYVEFLSTRWGYLGPSVTALEEARNEGALDWAPRELRRVEESIENLDQLLKPGLQDFTRVEELSRSSHEAADRLLQQVRQTRLQAARHLEGT
jgi:hypothetical protein